MLPNTARPYIPSNATLDGHGKVGSKLLAAVRPVVKESIYFAPDVCMSSSSPLWLSGEIKIAYWVLRGCTSVW